MAKGAQVGNTGTKGTRDRGSKGTARPKAETPVQPRPPVGLGKLLPRSFYEHAPEFVAPRLLGKLLVHGTGHGATGRGVMAGRIVEVEAYLGPHNDAPDPAAHSYRGPTPRNQVLFGPAGYSYVYSIYGMYFCMNITCEVEGLAGCVLLRALEPVAGLDRMAKNRDLAANAPPRLLTSGPGRLCEALGLTRMKHNGLDMTNRSSPLQVRDDDYLVREVLVTARIGIRHAVDWPLRLALPEHACVSGARNLTGTRVHLKDDSVEEISSVSVS
jgi:DNA-3-methyladenine glycosylase